MENEELVINDQELNTSEIQDNDSFLIEHEQENVLETESESIQENESEPPEELDGEIALEIAGEEIKPDDDDLIDGQPAPNWVKDLRRDFRNTQKENKELKRKLEEQNKYENSQNISINQPPKKPTLESCDFDDARYENELADWYEKKSHAEKAEKQKVQQQQEYQQRFNQRLEAHKTRAAKLPVKDYQEAEEVVRSELPDIHKELIIHCADEGSELIAYGLGKSKATRQRVIAEKDPLRAAYLLGQISQQVKLAPKPKKVINREPEIKGGGANASSDEFNKLCPGAKIE